MKFVKRYWIAGLVLILVVIHAIIIGYVRAEAARIKIAASNEIPAGVYYVQSKDRNWMSQLRVHLLVLPEQRLAAKASIEHHRWTIHEVIEEKLRQLDPVLLEDVVLLEIKEQIKLAIEDTLQQKIIERVLINDRVDFPLNQFQVRPLYNVAEPEPIFTSKPRRLEAEEM
jgi:hypothetical protein